jgi:hypothetical protein
VCTLWRVTKAWHQASNTATRQVATGKRRQLKMDKQAARKRHVTMLLAL